MQKSARACVGTGISILVAAAISLGPISLMPEDVAVPQRTVDVDPTALDIDSASLYRAIAQSEKGSADLSTPGVEAGATVTAPGTPDRTATAPDDVASVLANLALDGPDTDTVPSNRRPAVPPGLAISEGPDSDKHDVGGLLEGIAGGPSAPPPPADSPSESPNPASGPTPDIDPSLDGPAEPIGVPAKTEPNPVSEPGPAAATIDPETAGELAASDPGSLRTKAKRPDRRALWPLPGPVAKADADDAEGADGPNRSSGSEIGKRITERAQSAVRDIERSVRRAIDGLRPRRSSSSSPGE